MKNNEFSTRVQKAEAAVGLASLYMLAFTLCLLVYNLFL